MEISYCFIIPAYNEEDNIGDTIESIHEFGVIYPNFTPKIFIIDNGSSDKTVEIARAAGATVFIEPDLTVAGLRNFGVQQSNSDIIVFLDADVLLTIKWKENIQPVFEHLKSNQKLITGSNTIPIKSDNWFLKYWFKGFSDIKDYDHIGSAHIIISRQFFEQLDGFDATLTTSEDFDLCDRALASGGEVKNNSLLEVVHLDFPTEVTTFIKREAWHGSGECKSLRYALSSKAFIASLVFFFLIVLFFIQFLTKETILIPILLLIALLLLSSYTKFKQSGLKVVFINALIFNLFYIGRCVAILQCIYKKVTNYET